MQLFGGKLYPCCNYGKQGNFINLPLYSVNFPNGCQWRKDYARSSCGIVFTGPDGRPGLPTIGFPTTTAHGRAPG